MLKKSFAWMERQVALGWFLAACSILFVMAAALPAVQQFFARVEQLSADAEQRARPVVTMQGSLVSLTSTTAVVHIWGTKHRDCQYMGLQAFSVGQNGLLYDALVNRIDAPETNRSKPIGAFDIGYWAINPVVENAQAVRVYVKHMCAKTEITTLIANVPIP